MKKIKFKVTIDDANLILEGLGHLPFARVYGLVAKIQQQAQQQLNGGDPSGQQSDPEKPVPAFEN